MSLTNPARTHTERHFTGSEFVRDIVIGMPDGLTVPCARAAGLAEVAAGAIAMGLGGSMAGRTDIEHFASKRARGKREIGWGRSPASGMGAAAPDFPR